MLTTTSSETFNVFLQNWLEHQQVFLDQLIEMENNENNERKTEQIVRKVLSHYENYYEEKSKLIWEDIFLLFSPPWLTSFEKTFLWVGGFKPSLFFAILEVSVPSMGSEQILRLELLKAKTFEAESHLTDAMAMVQENMGSSRILFDLGRQEMRVVDGEVSDFDVVVQEMKYSMAKVVQSADDLRRKTVMKVVEILNWNQSVKFLVGVAKYQLGVRAWGLQYDAY